MRIFVATILLITTYAKFDAGAAEHPRLLFGKDDIPALKARAQNPKLKPVAERLMQRAEAQLDFRPLLVSLTKRGEKDSPGEMKGLGASRFLQGRVLTYCMAFTLSGEKKYRDAAVKELDHALTNWKIWVDTAHPPPFDLMTGEVCMTFGLAYDWLYNDLTPEERTRIREGCEKRGLSAYQAALVKKMGWTTCHHNWNTVCNGGATVAALAFEGESEFSAKTLEASVPNMKHYWEHLGADGGWDEGTGYWTFGNRYALLAAEALRRCGKLGGAEVFALEGVKRTAYFPIVFNPGTKLSASFGDSNSRAADPIFYLLGREYKNPDFIWFEDRAAPRSLKSEGWPQEALDLVWRPVDQDWLPEAKAEYTPRYEAVFAFPAIGWGMMASKVPDPAYFLGFKNGSLAANHTHLDLNTVNLAYGDTFLLQELGSRAYPADYFSKKRYSYYEISTQGQNSVLIGGKGQVLGKPGKLSGPLKGENYAAFVGSADGAYEVETKRARRMAVFVNNRYWVLLDDVATPKEQSIELRFHSYGSIKENGAGWLIEQDEAALDLVPMMENLKGGVEKPDGWTKPVNVLSLKTQKNAEAHVVATVLYPRGKNDAHVGEVKFLRADSKLTVSVGKDEIVFEMGKEGWGVKGVVVK